MTHNPHRRTPPPPAPNEELFVPKLTAEPFKWPESKPRDPYEAQRMEAERLCLWLACNRAMCRRVRRCVGPRAECTTIQRDVKRPLLDSI